MQELEVTWGRVASVWWLIAWRAVLGGIVFGFVVGFVGGFLGGAIGAAPDKVETIVTALAVPAGLAWGVVVVRMALRKRYRGFRLALVSEGG